MWWTDCPLDNLQSVLAVFLRAQVPEGQPGHACHDYEHLRASEGEPAGPLLLRPRRAAGDGPPDPPVRPQRHLPLAAVALLHAHRRGPHHHDGEAHAVPLQAVRRDWEDQEVKCSAAAAKAERLALSWWTYDMKEIVWTKTTSLWPLANFPLRLRHLEQLTFTPDRGCDCLWKWTECSEAESVRHVTGCYTRKAGFAWCWSIARCFTGTCLQEFVTLVILSMVHHEHVFALSPIIATHDKTSLYLNPQGKTLSSVKNCPLLSRSVSVLWTFFWELSDILMIICDCFLKQ